MSGERRTLQNYAYWSSRKTYRSKRGPVPTLGELQRGDGKWCWLWCEKCWRKAPFAFAAAVIQWGADASSDVLRQRAAGEIEYATPKHNASGFERAAGLELE